METANARYLPKIPRAAIVESLHFRRHAVSCQSFLEDVLSAKHAVLVFRAQMAVWIIVHRAFFPSQLLLLDIYSFRIYLLSYLLLK